MSEARSSSERSTTPASSPEPISVLYVDDDEAFADLTALHLERITADDPRPISVLCVTDPTDALSHFDDVDCIVSDYEMPVLDGIDLLNALQEYDDGIPFIIFTGRGSEQVASRAISAGVNDYLCKGGQSDTFVVLANRVQEAVARYEAERDLERRTRRLRHVIDLLPQSIFVKNAEGRFLLVNERGAAMYDRTPAEVEGRDESDLLAPDIETQFDAEGREVIDSVGAVQLVAQRPDGPDGDRRVERVLTVPFDSVGGAEDAVLGVVTDVTAEHRLFERCDAVTDVLDTTSKTLDEARAAHNRGDDVALVDRHNRLDELLTRLQRLAPDEELEEFLSHPSETGLETD